MLKYGRARSPNEPRTDRRSVPTIHHSFHSFNLLIKVTHLANFHSADGVLACNFKVWNHKIFKKLPLFLRVSPTSCRWRPPLGRESRAASRRLPSPPTQGRRGSQTRCPRPLNRRCASGGRRTEYAPNLVFTYTPHLFSLARLNDIKNNHILGITCL